MESLRNILLEPTSAEWITAGAIAGGAIALAFIVRWTVGAFVRKRSAHSDFPLTMVRRFIFPAIILAGLYAAVHALAPERESNTLISGVFVVLFSFVAIRFVVAVVNELFRRAATRTEIAHWDLTRIRPLRAISVLVVWIAGLLFLLANLGFDITAVVAGLGIGGIAIALAAQALLGDLFSYFVIVFDRPFEIGDFLIFDDVLGSVERIGVKTTRLRSLGGELIIVSNSDLTSSRVRNYKRMERRRVVFRIGVVYATPVDQVKEIPSIIRSVIERDEHALFDRAHFASYGDWSLVFEVVYNVASPDYNVYMDIQERINLAIFEEFASRGIEFAFPTQTVQLHRNTP